MAEKMDDASRLAVLNIAYNKLKVRSSFMLLVSFDVLVLLSDTPLVIGQCHMVYDNKSFEYPPF